MRHASRLCRGFPEVSRSLERPYIPRHVPLPSSSYSVATKGSDILVPPKDRIGTAAKLAETYKLSQAPAEDDVATRQQHDQHSTPTSSTAQQTRTDRAKIPPTALIQPRKDPKAAQRTQRKTFASPSQPNATSSAAVSPSKPTSERDNARTSLRLQQSKNSSRNDIPGSNSDPTRIAPQSKLTTLIHTYPQLSSAQADLLLQIFRQVRAFRSKPPNALISWYEDLIWTHERQSPAAEKLESPQSLSLLMRYAYQRNDLRSLLRIEDRAARLFKAKSRASSNTSPSTRSLKQLGGPEVDGVGLWPDMQEDPIRTAYNLKVSFAAKHGNWIKVDELLDDAGIDSVAQGRLRRKGGSRFGTRSALDAVGWGSLLRFGLGGGAQVSGTQQTKSPNPAEVAKPEGRTLRGMMQSSALSSTEGSDIAAPSTETTEAKQAQKAKEEKAQAEAKLSVTKRLLPHLLRYTSADQAPSTSDARVSPQSMPDNPASAVAATPAWLLQSVLTQLAERGETASTIRIIQLALSEKSTFEQHAATSRGTTAILNLALTACVQDRTVNLTETLRVFNALTGSQLGLGITGPAVVARPASARSHTTKSEGGPEAEMQNPEEGSACRIAPNEESLVLVLKNVRHPLFRAAWSRKLVEDFQRLFPWVRLSGRTFRIIIDKSVVPAPSATAVEATTPPVTEPQSESSVHVVASGRRGRRLRQDTANQAPAATLPEASQALSSRRGPIIKLAILESVLRDILLRFQPEPDGSSARLHLSTTNRRRFEHTLLKAQSILLGKKLYHQAKIPNEPKKQGFAKHHTDAIADIDRLIDLIAQVQRLGRAEEARRKQSQPSLNE